ncbi:PREDICTED: uncharacterized protein LOC109235727 isoform X1 [Nicotiana attenuata]|uniref:4Fe-4S ferredoxin-type domain-containing protein n=1 Tax=Nicotiana attenuata TaxID=49451 RepID=A0A1J6IBU7_NICAT|nr:PREDICTED: uncharacterized protein LOC109235727 isoform X1 [Nicotiana attenuata]OIS96442.1 hypothetical protein A4A49_36470 [Nicotiana attenuata]
MMALSIPCCASLGTKLRAPLNSSNYNDLEKVKSIIKKTVIPSITNSPVESLQKGNWVKLICGASFEDLVDIRNLSLVYTLAGVDCIDCAAEASVVNAVSEGVEAARAIVPIRRPWIMISVNDDEDLHFRKAEFDPDDCPQDCTRPCEKVCPANAILQKQGGVLAERCYGCGRCLPVCPYDKISAITYVRDVTATAKLLERDDVDAIEIHTSGRVPAVFRELWTGLGNSTANLKLVAVSFPDLRDSTISAMEAMYSIMETNIQCLNLWQLDGRPMSGDIGRGATRDAIAFARKLASAGNKPKGFLQLAGGTNAHTIEGLKKERLFQTTTIHEASDYEKIPSSSLHSPNALIAGVAFGGYARKIVGRVLNSVQNNHGLAHVEDFPELLLQAIIESLALVGTVKCYNIQKQIT